MNTFQIKMGAILSYISIILKIGVSILYTPIMLRILGQSEYGLYQMVASIISHLSILNLGFNSSYIKFFSDIKHKGHIKEISKLNGLFFIVYLFLAIFVSLLGLILSNYTGIIFGGKLNSSEISTAKLLLIILVINLGLSFVNLLFAGYISANEKFIFQKLLEILQTIIGPFIQIPLLLSGFGSVGVVLGLAVASLMIYIFNILYCFRKLNMTLTFKNLDFSKLKAISGYSYYIFLAMIIDQINWNVDVYLVGRFYGTISTAIYSIAELIDTYFRNFSVAFSSLLTPRIHQMIISEASDMEVTKLFTKIGRIQFMITALLATGFLFFGKAFINMWAGEGYADSYYIAVILIVPLIVPITQSSGIELRRAKNMQKFYTIVSSITALANVILTIILLSYLPPIGAAISTSVTLILNSIVLNWHYKYRMKIDIGYFWKEIFQLFIPLSITCIFGYLLTQLLDIQEVKYFVIGILIYVLIYTILMWFLGLKKSEKDLLNFNRN